MEVVIKRGVLHIDDAIDAFDKILIPPINVKIKYF